MTGIYLGNQAVYDPLVLPNNSRINGVEHFYQTTKPTTRGDGSALGIGDRWWKTDDGTEWSWNGTYWLGEKFVIGVDLRNRPEVGNPVVGKGSGVFFWYAESHLPQPLLTPVNWDSDNYYYFYLSVGASTVIPGDNRFPEYRILQWPSQFFSLNLVYIGPGKMIFPLVRKQGNPTENAYSGTSSLNFTCSLIAP